MYLLPQTIKSIRKDKKILQKDIAKFLNLPLRTYQSYEYGEVEINIKILIKLADFFDVSLDYLVGRTDNPNSHKK